MKAEKSSEGASPAGIPSPWKSRVVGGLIMSLVNPDAPEERQRPDAMELLSSLMQSLSGV